MTGFWPESDVNHLSVFNTPNVNISECVEHMLRNTMAQVLIVLLLNEQSESMQYSCTTPALLLPVCDWPLFSVVYSAVNMWTVSFHASLFTS